jgi:hypothetical protein
MPTYATDIFDGDGSTDEFDLTFSFISRDHVGVKSINKASGAETVLTVIETGVPTGNEYRWENDTRIKVGTAPLSTQQIKIERDTPEDQQLVPWTDGSYLLSEDLNTSDLQWLYGLQELEDQITELNGSGAGAAVKGVTGAAPVQVDEADKQNPVVSVDQLDSTANPNTALTSDTDLLSAKAVDAFYSQIVGSGAGYPAGSVGKDGKLRIDPSGPTPNLYYWNQASTSWVQLPTKGDTGSQGPVGPAPGLQSPAAYASNVSLKGDGTVGDATASVVQDGSGDLKFSFGVPVGETGATGATGPQGQAATVTAGSATSLAYDAAPTVSNSGSSSSAVFNFGIPKGMPQTVGIAGIPPTSIAGSPVKPGDLWLDDNTLQLYVYYKDPSNDEYWVSVSRMGEQGPAATVAVGVTTTGSPGSSASVANNGTSGAAVLNFTIPRGDKGDKGDTGDDGSDSTVPGPVGPGATVDVGTTTTLAAGNNAYVSNTGTTTNAYLQFGIPKGDTGSTGQQGLKGDTGTIVVDETITLASDQAANVVNIGTNTEAELVFYIPQGIPGDPQDVYSSDARPTTINGSPVRAGALWFNTSNAQLYAYYVDPSGDEYWVSTTSAPQAFAKVGSSPPSSPTQGQLFYDTTDSKLQVYVNGSWTDV